MGQKVLLVFTLMPLAYAQQASNVTWCTVSSAEHLKCTEFAEAVRTAGRQQLAIELLCARASSKDQCMNYLDNQKADVVELDPGELLSAGGYHSVIPILSELYGPENQAGFYSVAVVHRYANITELRHLRGRKGCFSSVGDMAGWVVPMAQLIDRGVLEITDCNNLVKSASHFFGPSCAPNSLLDKHNPTGDNPQQMCDICAGQAADRCSGNDPFSNYEGAFRCLETEGEIAFVKHTTVLEATAPDTSARHRFQLLCLDGRMQPVERYESCNWGFVPSNVIATSSETSTRRRKEIQDFLFKALLLFGRTSAYVTETSTNNRDYQTSFDFDPFGTSNSKKSDAQEVEPYNPFADDKDGFNKLAYESKDNFDYRPPWDTRRNGRFNLLGRYRNQSNLLLQDRTRQFVRLEGQRQTYAGFLGSYLEVFQKLGRCPVASAGFCVASPKEYDKCQQMRAAFKAQNLKPDIHCVRAPSQLVCMHMIQQGNADLAMFEAGDIYRAGARFGLKPILAEQYNLAEPSYYAVAVAQQKDKDTDLLYLKGKRVCSSGMFTAAGYIIPLAFLLTNDRMRAYGCDSARAMSEFFSKGCVPGALNEEFAGPNSRDYKSYRNLCDLCHGESRNYCRRDASEQFFGHAGAFRCLVEGGGEVAFVKHTTIFENTAGRNPLPWARNVGLEDFELLCRDGSRQTFDKYRECNLGKVAANAMMTASRKRPEEIDAYIALFVYAQQFYGSKYSEEFTFKMFVSDFDYPDLIFQDSTQQLQPVPEERRNFRRYLGLDFLSAVKLVDCEGTVSSAPKFVLLPHRHLIVGAISVVVALLHMCVTH